MGDRLKGKRAFVTAGAAGIGRACAIARPSATSHEPARIKAASRQWPKLGSSRAETANAGNQTAATLPIVAIRRATTGCRLVRSGAWSSGSAGAASPAPKASTTTS